jgi:hypothetical protein
VYGHNPKKYDALIKAAIRAGAGVHGIDRLEGWLALDPERYRSWTRYILKHQADINILLVGIGHITFWKKEITRKEHISSPAYLAQEGIKEDKIMTIAYEEEAVLNEFSNGLKKREERAIRLDEISSGKFNLEDIRAPILNPELSDILMINLNRNRGTIGPNIESPWKQALDDLLKTDDQATSFSRTDGGTLDNYTIQQIREIVTGLQHSFDAVQHKDAVRQLRKDGNTDVVGWLAAVLQRCEDGNIRLSAVIALSRFSADPRTVDLLLATLENPYTISVGQVAGILEMLNAKEAIPVLEELLQSYGSELGAYHIEFVKIALISLKQNPRVTVGQLRSLNRSSVLFDGFFSHESEFIKELCTTDLTLGNTVKFSQEDLKRMSWLISVL